MDYETAQLWAYAESNAQRKLEAEVEELKRQLAEAATKAERQERQLEVQRNELKRDATALKKRQAHLNSDLEAERRRVALLERQLEKRQAGRGEALALLTSTERYLREAVEATPRHSDERKDGEAALEKLTRAQGLVRGLGAQ